MLGGRLTPDDIDKQVFKEKLRGYDQGEVDAFLDRVAEALGRVIRERDELAGRIGAVERDAAEAVEAERLLKRTLLTAQRTAEETIGEARATAEATVSRAREHASQIVGQARQEAAQLQEQVRREAAEERARLQWEAQQLRDAVRDLQRFRTEYRDRVKAVIAEHLAVIERVGDLPDVPPEIETLAQRLDGVG